MANADDLARRCLAPSSPCSSSKSPAVASILVNCAGITRDGRIGNLSDRDWCDVLDVNLKGTFLMCQAFCEPKRLSELLVGGNMAKEFGTPASSVGDDSTLGQSKFGIGGSIINIGSIVSSYGNYGQVNYAASKGGVVGLTRSLAKEMASLSWKTTSAVDNIGDNDNEKEEEEEQNVSPTVRVNCIQPGFIQTPMADAVPEKILSDMTRKIALRRLGRAEDVANLALFLASSERSGYVTGEAFECSGMLRL
mmetsp:Transcript_12351/g.22294  ORF Transcript_12351/g.22294 Transcript_12351/m.22294 type:complete len:251 (-) Transcript_12351:238-990(-)